MADGSVKIDIDGDASKFKSEMDEVETEAKGAAGGLDDLDKGAEGAGEGLDAAGVAAGSFAAEIANNLLGAIAGAISSIMQLADETREYREDMAKLETAFSVAGHSTETASKAYEDFYAILGESDRSVEAVNHLAELTKNEQEVAKWSDICAGVTAKFGDSLPIEGLTEAANETAKVGKVTGPLADALNWAGISEDEFNAKLAECNSEQERATLITETLNEKYKEAADEYNELTASAQANNRATSRLADAQAEVGAALEPAITAWKNMKAEALEAIIPLVQFLGEKFQELTTWMSEHETAATILKTVVIGLATALGVLVVWFGALSIIKSVQAAFAALNITMSMNPVLLIVAAIAALVAAFIYLWNNCEEFRAFWIGLWDNVKVIVSDVVEQLKIYWGQIKTDLQPTIDWLKEIWSLCWEAIKAIWDTVGAYFAAVWATIKGIFAVVQAVLSGDFEGAWEAIKGILLAWVPYFKSLWNSIKAVFSVVSAWFKGIWQSAWNAIKLIWNAVVSYYQGIWNGIMAVFSAIGSWFSSKFTEAKNAIFNAWSNVVSTFTGYKDEILGAFSDIKSKFLSVGSNIVAGIKSGVSNAWDSFVSWIEGKVGGILKAVKKALGIKSPARKFIPVGTMSVKGMEVGFDNEFPNLEKDMESKLAGLTAQANAAISADNATMARTTGARDTGFSELARAVGNQSAGIHGLSSAYRSGSNKPVIIELNGRELGRAVVDVGGKEEKRVGSRMKVGAAYA